MEQTVPDTGHNVVAVTREELSGLRQGPHLVDEEGSPAKGSWLLHCAEQLLEPLMEPWRRPIEKTWENTYRLNTSTLGQAPVGPVRLSRSWRDFLRPMKQQEKYQSTCSLVASTMAVEGMHCKVFETFHAHEKFPDAWKASGNWTDQLVRTCKDQRIWKEDEGAVVDNVLYHIQKKLGGVRTASGEVMPLAGYKKHSGRELTPERVADLLDQGPCIGRLFAAPWYNRFDAKKNDNWVYRGCGRDQATRDDCREKNPKEKNIGSHVIVCFQYRVCQISEGKEEMHVCVLDNHSNHGPERWVDVEELDAIYSLKVDCMCHGDDTHASP